MKPLPTLITRKGWTMKLMQRKGDIAIYQRTLDGERKHWEVIRVQKAKRDYTFPNGSKIHAGDESYPGDSTWGRHGFTCMSPEAALKKYKELTR